MLEPPPPQEARRAIEIKINGILFIVLLQCQRMGDMPIAICEQVVIDRVSDDAMGGDNNFIYEAIPNRFSIA